MASPMERCGLLSRWVTICVVIVVIANATAKYPDELCNRNQLKRGKDSLSITASAKPDEPQTGKDTITAWAKPDDFDLEKDAHKAKLPTVSFQVDCVSDSSPSKAVSFISACTVTTSSFSQTLKEKDGYFLSERTSQFELPRKADSSQWLDCYVTCFAKIKPTIYCFAKLIY